MIPQASRAALRTAAPRVLLRTAVPRRLASSRAPADRPRSWKSFALRWGVAIGSIYYYNTSPYFQDIVYDPLPQKSQTPIDAEQAPTLEDLAATRRARLAAAANNQPDPTAAPPPPTAVPASSPADLESEAAQQGAFNEETGEINWDCPCLGGMAHGPCGPEFREAFSCFVYSKEEPKGIECIDRFKGMQECFRKYPEIYAAELSDDDEVSEGAVAAEEGGAPVGGAIAGAVDKHKAAEKPEGGERAAPSSSGEGKA